MLRDPRFRANTVVIIFRVDLYLLGDVDAECISETSVSFWQKFTKVLEVLAASIIRVNTTNQLCSSITRRSLSWWHVCIGIEQFKRVEALNKANHDRRKSRSSVRATQVSGSWQSRRQSLVDVQVLCKSQSFLLPCHGRSYRSSCASLFYRPSQYLLGMSRSGRNR